MVDLPRLFEYDTVDVALSERRARRLDSEAGRYLSVSPHPDPGIWSVTAREYVGTLVVDDMRILIRPKIRLENLFLMLEVGLPPQAWRKEDFDYATNPDLLQSLVSFYARTLETTLARGLYRSYRNRNEDLKAIRGRIDFGRQLSRARLPMPVACRYGEFTSDVIENRGLRAAIRLSLRVPGVTVTERRRAHAIELGSNGRGIRAYRSAAMRSATNPLQPAERSLPACNSVWPGRCSTT